jgi:hypothetical protein
MIIWNGTKTPLPGELFTSLSKLKKVKIMKFLWCCLPDIILHPHLANLKQAKKRREQQGKANKHEKAFDEC